MVYGPSDGPEWAAWTFPARVDRVVDGDTIDVTADLGFRVRSNVRIRLRGVDTAEVYGVKRESDEYAEGQAHSAFVEKWVAAGQRLSDRPWPFILATEAESGKYGRWVGDLIRRDEDTDRRLTVALIDMYPDAADR